MTRNVRVVGRHAAETTVYARAKARESARESVLANFRLKIAKAATTPTRRAIQLRKHFRTRSGHKTAKVTHLSKPYSPPVSPINMTRAVTEQHGV